MKISKIATVVCAALLLHGCDGESTPVTTPAASDTSSTTRLDTQSPTVMAMTPANNAVRVNAQSNIEITFSEALDAATITRETVRLRFKTAAGDSGPVPASITYSNASHTITINPTRPYYGVKLTLMFTGVKDLAGNAAAETTYSMSTYINPSVAEVTRNPAMGGAITDYDAFAYGVNNLLTRATSYNGAGADSIWGNTDDILSAVRQYFYNPDNSILRVISYLSPTIIGEYAQGTYDTSGNTVRTTRYIGPGANNDWDYLDDLVGGYTSYSYDNRGNVLRATIYTGPGADLTWYTSDDFFVSDIISAYDASSNRTRARTARIGADGIWGTADDSRVAVLYTHDAAGNTVREVSYPNAGPDLFWFTEDDPIVGYTAIVYDNNGQGTQRIFYNAIGADNAWFTTDDAISHYDTFDYDAAGNNTRITRYSGKGPDNAWFTPDDVIFTYNLTSYDPSNNRIQGARFVSSGVDTLWFTADDISSSNIAYNTAF